MAGPVSLKHSCIMYRNMQAFWHVTLIKINYYYYYYYYYPAAEKMGDVEAA